MWTRWPCLEDFDYFGLAACGPRGAEQEVDAVGPVVGAGHAPDLLAEAALVRVQLPGLGPCPRQQLGKQFERSQAAVAPRPLQRGRLC